MLKKFFLRLGGLQLNIKICFNILSAKFLIFALKALLEAETSDVYQKFWRPYLSNPLLIIVNQPDKINDLRY